VGRCSRPGGGRLGGVDSAEPALCAPEVAPAEAAGMPVWIAVPTDSYGADGGFAESPGADSEATSPDRGAEASALRLSQCRRRASR